MKPLQAIAHYQVIGQLGAGGMGKVFRARDTRLDRDAAIEVLPKDLARDADRLLRFEEEGQGARRRSACQNEVCTILNFHRTEPKFFTPPTAQAGRQTAIGFSTPSAILPTR